MRKQKVNLFQIPNKQTNSHSLHFFVCRTLRKERKYNAAKRKVANSPRLIYYTLSQYIVPPTNIFVFSRGAIVSQSYLGFIRNTDHLLYGRVGFFMGQVMLSREYWPVVLHLARLGFNEMCVLFI